MRKMRFEIFKQYEIPYLIDEITPLDNQMLQWDFEHLILAKKHDGWLPDKARGHWFTRAICSDYNNTIVFKTFQEQIKNL